MLKTIEGTIKFRSSSPGAKGPPGEAEILGLNPIREEKLKAIAGWSRVEPGTLNVKCSEEDIVVFLGRCKPDWEELGQDVIYPPGWAQIPLTRKSYSYYLADLKFNATQLRVIVRRALVPIKRRLELFAEKHLCSELNLVEGSTVKIQLLCNSALESEKIGSGTSDLNIPASKAKSDVVAVAPSAIGSYVHENWIASSKQSENFTMFEYDLYSDAIIPTIKSKLGPYDLLSTKREVPTLQFSAAAVLRVKFHLPPTFKDADKQDIGRYHGGSLAEEFAALTSLISGVRIRAAENYSRRWGFNDDPLGEPIQSHEPKIVPRLALTAPILPQVLSIRRDAEFDLLARFASVSPEESRVLAIAARQYQNALWYAEIEPNQSWLFLVSAVETVAQFWRLEQASAVERFQEARPKAAKLLVTAGGELLLNQIAEELADYMGATKKFVTFLLEYLPSEPPIRPSNSAARIDWTSSRLKKSLTAIYGQRSKSLHGGVPFPPPMLQPPSDHERPAFTKVSHEGAMWSAADCPMYLQTFEYIVRGAIVNWWRSLTKNSV